MFIKEIVESNTQQGSQKEQQALTPKEGSQILDNDAVSTPISPEPILNTANNLDTAEGHAWQSPIPSPEPKNSTEAALPLSLRLLQAMFNNDLDLVKSLLSQGATFEKVVEFRTKNPTNDSANQQKPKNEKDKSDDEDSSAIDYLPENSTVLTGMAFEQENDLLIFLLEYPEMRDLINIPNACGQTPLFWSLYYFDTTLTKQLLCAGASLEQIVEPITNYRTPTEEVISSGLNNHLCTLAAGSSFLMWLTSNSKNRGVNKILDYLLPYPSIQKTISIKNIRGEDALYWALRQNNRTVISKLREYGATLKDFHKIRSEIDEIEGEDFLSELQYLGCKDALNDIEKWPEMTELKKLLKKERSLSTHPSPAKRVRAPEPLPVDSLWEEFITKNNYPETNHEKSLEQWEGKFQELVNSTSDRKLQDLLRGKRISFLMQRVSQRSLDDSFNSQEQEGGAPQLTQFSAQLFENSFSTGTVEPKRKKSKNNDASKVQ